MKKITLSLILFICSCILSGPKGVLAEEMQPSKLSTVLESGKLRAGTQAFASPFAFRREDGDFEGFSVDLLKLITKSISQGFNKELKLEISEITAENRFSAVSSGDVDIVCGLTTVTNAREKVIDFSVPYFVDGIRILVRRDKTIESVSGLKGASVGVLENSTTIGILENYAREIDLISFDDIDKAMQSFVAGRIAGVSNVGVLLANKQREYGGEFSMEIIPRGRSLKSEYLACILPQDESSFRDAVNFALVDSYKDINSFGGQYMEIYLKWFGRNGFMNFPISDHHRSLLANTRIWID
jgi:polar amino acid transport system substrate-binding protein